MEFSKIQEVVLKSKSIHGSPIVITEGGGVVVGGGTTTNSAAHYPHPPAEFDFLPIQSAERLLILDENGVLREAFAEYLVPHMQTVVMEDDTEIPAHVLDHMYAKKPREPGTEPLPTKPRRRAKRSKDQVVEQYIIPDAHPPAPKINIIRQRLPTTSSSSSSPSSSSYKSSLPKILQQGGSGGGGPSPTKQGGLDHHHQSVFNKGGVGGNKGVHHRTSKKEDHAKTMYASFEEPSKQMDKGTKGSSNKDGGGSVGVGMESSSNKKGNSSNNNNNNVTKPTGTSSAIILDDLQRVGAVYDEMLFDFGIAEDDEAIAISSSLQDGFSDGEFDEFKQMTTGMDNPKSSTSNKSSKGGGGGKRETPTHQPQFPSMILPDDDDSNSNQIMVSITGGRRPSQDWGQIFNQSSKPCAKGSSSSSSSGVLNLVNLDQEGVIKPEDEIKLEDDMKLEDQELSNLSLHNGALNSNNSKRDSLSSLDSIRSLGSPSSGKDLLTSSSTSPSRRSSRVIKTPAWLEDSNKIPIRKKRK